MHNLQIPTCKTLVYNPAYNRQIEKNNDIIWCGVKLAFKDQKFVYFKMGGSFATSSAFRVFSIPCVLCIVLLQIQRHRNVSLIFTALHS